MLVFYVFYRKVVDIFIIFLLIKVFWKFDLYILYKGDKIVEWFWGEILMLNIINIYWRDGLYKKKILLLYLLYLN